MPQAPHLPSGPHADLADFDAIKATTQSLRDQLARIIVGQEPIVDSLITAVLCQGHVLIVGVPGLAKTLLVRTLAQALGLTFKRIQFTPDMMPADVLGTELIQQDPDTQQRLLKFLPGPIFAQLLLADEINRTPPKTQAALLEAMAEHQVTVAGQTRPLEAPFLVVATQNPIEQEGTYPLPEAQLDRFMFSLWIDYPGKQQEIDVVTRTPEIADKKIEQVLDRDRLLRFASAIFHMPVSPHVVDFAVTLARATRPGSPEAPDMVRRYVAWGAGPRASQALIHAAKAAAAIAGHPAPSVEDVSRVALPVLRHRVLVNYHASSENITPEKVIQHVLEQAVHRDHDA